MTATVVGRPPRQPPLRKRRWLVWTCWGYAALAIAATVLLWVTGDRWWGGTLLCFAPRWPLAIPSLVLAVVGVRSWRTTFPPLMVSGVALACWLGLVVPLGRVDPSRQLPFRAITFNMQGSHADLSAFALWALEQRPDVMFFQESSGERLKQLMGPDWHWRESTGGLALASRHPILNVEAADAERPNCLCASLQVETYVVRVGVVHLPTPRDGLESLVFKNRKFIDIMATERRNRVAASRAASEFLLGRMNVDVVGGDFNMPVESRIYQEFWSEATNAFSSAGWGLGHTKFTRWHGVRIDHILIANPAVGAVHAYVGPALGSDHRPVFAELALPLINDPK
jgi:vancomycin resistance protein VanJ